MQEKDVDNFVMFMELMQSLNTAICDSASHEVTQLYNRQILAWDSYGKDSNN